MKSKLLEAIAAMFLATLLLGCANRPPVEISDTFAYPSRFDMAEVPFFPQQPLHCGPAALATVLVYYQRNVTPDSLAAFLFTPGAKGTYALDMAASVRREGLIPFPAPSELESLLSLTAQGWPSIHLMNLGFSRLPKWHYAVLVGYDLEKGAVLMRSGKDRLRWYSFYHFQRSRALADYWSIIPAPVTSVPQLNNWLDAYAAIVDFEQVHPESVEAAWRSATSVYPTQWQFPFAWGNHLWSTGNFSAAEQAYRAGLERAPNLAKLWNNIGYAFHSQTCFEQAQSAIHCAMALEPLEAEWQSSVIELSGESQGSQCLPLLTCPAIQ